MRDYESAFDLQVDDAESGWDPAFAVFVLAHARCDDELVEVRIGERLLVAWCPSCTALETFGPAASKEPGRRRGRSRTGG